jgi:uncharacterized protein DUF3775
MESLSRAIYGIPRPYLRNRRAGLIFPVAAATFFGVNGFCRGRPGAVPGAAASRADSAFARPAKDRHLRTVMADEDLENTPDLSISPDKVCYIIAKAREFDAKDVVTDPDDSSNPTDDAMVAVLEDHRDDPVVQEIAAAIFAMSEDEQIDLVTLAWLGRGDGSLEDWNELRAEAARAHNKRTASYLLGMPLLADYLDEALAQFGHSCDE